jgi:hypothetical protein
MVCRLEVQLVATARPTTSDEGLEVVECANGEVAELVLAFNGAGIQGARDRYRRPSNLTATSRKRRRCAGLDVVNEFLTIWVRD